MSDSEHEIELETPTSIEVKSEVSPVKEAISVIYENLGVAQARTGAFTLKDCKALRDHKDHLHKCVDDGSVDKEGSEAFQFLSKALDVQQSKGVFSIDGAITLLEKLEVVEKWIQDNKSASMKLQEAKDKLKEERKKKK